MFRDIKNLRIRTEEIYLGEGREVFNDKSTDLCRDKIDIVIEYQLDNGETFWEIKNYRHNLAEFIKKPLFENDLEFIGEVYVRPFGGNFEDQVGECDYYLTVPDPIIGHYTAYKYKLKV